ncbi:MAG: uracil-DNA glycosylase, partial [Paenibacillus sp.]|nr:uracil-DNA glycosylase [Paenibacillus sp.]
MAIVSLKNDWAALLEREMEQPYYSKLSEFLDEEYGRGTIFPERDDLFNALHYTSLADTKVVILGQDPYHGPGQAHGLSFSVKEGVAIPPSLVNMFKELRDDLGCYMPNHGYLLEWAKQGVLLLNTVLTVRANEANSHKGQGWESFTDQIIKTVNDKDEPVVFLLWGSHAQKKAELITNKRHLQLRAP